MTFPFVLLYVYSVLHWYSLHTKIFFSYQTISWFAWFWGQIFFSDLDAFAYFKACDLLLVKKSVYLYCQWHANFSSVV
jgi:hypothetical protein